MMSKTASLVFTGDIGFDHYMDKKWEDRGLLTDSVRGFLQSGNHLIVNVEGPLSYGDKSMRDNSVSALMHSMDPKVADFLSSINADVWNICNNHIMDAGALGLEDTLFYANEKKAKTLGAGRNISEASKPVIFDEAGGIGMIGVGYQRACRKAGEDTPGCFSWSDLDLIEKRITEIKKTCRWCIVVAHAGEEFTCLPSPYTRERFHKYLEFGADIVVAHHPHVPMNYETVGNKAIFYSLGNFIFDTDYQRSQINTEKGVFVRLDFSEDNFSFSPFGIKINRVNENVEEADLPDIFTDVSEKEYELLEPLSAKAFICATKRQQMYLKPNVYSADTTEEEWHENFYEPLRSGRVPGETLDFQIIVPIAEKEKERAWENSSLDKVKKYILEHIPKEKDSRE